MAESMRAIVISKFGGPEVFEYRDDVPKPIPGPDEVLIRVYAFGVNHAEMRECILIQLCSNLVLLNE